LPENDRDVREALIAAGRTDLIGSGPKCLIPARPPKGAKQRGARKGRSGRKRSFDGKAGSRRKRR
jgi:hypothetical protein